MYVWYRNQSGAIFCRAPLDPVVFCLPWFRGCNFHLSKVRAALAEFVIRRQTSTTSQNPLISSVQLLAMDETESKTRLPSTTGVQVGTAPLVMLHARLKNRHEHEESSKHVSSAYVFIILAMIRG